MIYYSDGTTKEVQPANGTNFRLKEVQAIVGGLVEIVDLKDNMIMLLNEEGKLLGLERNEAATKLAELPSALDRWRARLTWEEQGWTVIDTMIDEEENYIAGDVLVCEDREFR